MSGHDPAPVGAEEAAAFLSTHLGRRSVAVEQVGEGMWSRAFAFTRDGEDLVVRFGQHRDDYEKDAVAGTFASAELPVPQVLEIGEAFDGHFAISTRAWGEPLEALDADGWRATLPALLAALDAVRQIPVPTDAGFGLWTAAGQAPHATWRDYLLGVDDESPTRRTTGWRDLLAATAVGDEPFRRALHRLDELSVDLPPQHHVIHADLINRNVLVADGRLAAVLDWGCSAYGDPLYDVAWLEHWAPWWPGLAAVDIRSVAWRHHVEHSLDTTDFDRRIWCSALHIGLDHQAYNAWVGDEPTLEAVVARTQHYLDQAT